MKVCPYCLGKVAAEATECNHCEYDFSKATEAPRSDVPPPPVGAEAVSEGIRTKVCPFCAEEIREEAKLCRFCKSDLSSDSSSKPSPAYEKAAAPKSMRNFLIGGAVGLVALAGGIAFTGFDEMTGKTMKTTHRCGGNIKFKPFHEAEVTPDFKKYDGDTLGTVTGSYEIVNTEKGKLIIVHYPIQPGQMRKVTYQLKPWEGGTLLVSAGSCEPLAYALVEEGVTPPPEFSF